MKTLGLLLVAWLCALDARAASPPSAPWFSAEEDARRKPRLLRETLLLRDGARLEDVELVVRPPFRADPWNAVVRIVGRNVTLRNVVVRAPYAGWQEEWRDLSGKAPHPVHGSLKGVLAQKAVGLVVDGLHVEGLPNDGFLADGVDAARLERLSATRVRAGVLLGPGCSRNVLLRFVRVWDTWGPPPGHWQGWAGSRSRRRPGGWSGGDGLALRLCDSTVSDVELSGEMFVGVKVLRSRGLTLTRLRVPSLMVQGNEVAPGRNLDGSHDGAELTVTEATIDRSSAGHPERSQAAVQISWSVRLLLERFSVLGGAGVAGDGIQLAGPGVHARLSAGVISGFRGEGGVALRLVSGATVNADVLRAVRFADNRQDHAGLP